MGSSQVFWAHGKLRKSLPSSSDARPNHPTSSIRARARMLQKVNLLGVAHSWDGAGPKKERRREGTSETNGPLVTLHIEVSRPISPSINRPTTWRRFQRHALPIHYRYASGRCSVELQPQFHGAAAAVVWSRRGILKAHVCILTAHQTVLSRP